MGKWLKSRISLTNIKNVSFNLPQLLRYQLLSSAAIAMLWTHIPKMQLTLIGVCLLLIIKFTLLWSGHCIDMVYPFNADDEYMVHGRWYLIKIHKKINYSSKNTNKNI